MLSLSLNGNSPIKELQNFINSYIYDILGLYFSCITFPAALLFWILKKRKNNKEIDGRTTNRYTLGASYFFLRSPHFEIPKNKMKMKMRKKLALVLEVETAVDDIVHRSIHSDVLPRSQM